MRIALLAAAAIFASMAPAAAQDTRTTRIETRPFYGATVTIEEGVRVFRSLPPHDRIVINPGGRTSLNLSLEEHRSTSHNYHYERSGAAAPAPEGSAGAYLPFGARPGHGGHRGGSHGAVGAPAGR